MLEKYDIVLVGSGFSCWACACALLENGLSVAVLSRPNDRNQVGEYLPPEGVQAMSALGLGSLLEFTQHRKCPATLSLWEGGAPTRRDVMMQPGGRALNLDRAQLDKSLRKRALAKNARLILSGKLLRLSGGKDEWILDCEASGKRLNISARYLLDATGRAAALARKLGSKITRHDDLIGIAGMFEHISTDDASLRVEALLDGWCYAAPLSSDRLAAVFLSNVNDLPAKKAERNAIAMKHLKNSDLIGPLISSSTTEQVAFKSVPAWSQITEPNIGPGWMAIGDAAMASDPLASAGLTKGLVDITALLKLFENPDTERDLIAQRSRRYAGYRQTLAQNYSNVTGKTSPFWIRRKTK